VIDDGYTNWARWIDQRVDRLPWSVVVGLWLGVAWLAIKAF
jgi:hypothetical protein